MRNWVAAFMLAMCSTALAGPDATANRFLGDTVSMMDWGMFRMQQLINQNTTYGPQTTVSYDWDSNQIVVRRFRTIDLAEAGVLEADCKKWFDDTRYNGFVLPSTGELFGFASWSRYAGMFAHNGFSRTISGQDEEKSLSELDKLIHLSFATWGPDAAEQMVCTGPLIDTGFSVKR